MINDWETADDIGARVGRAGSAQPGTQGSERFELPVTGTFIVQQDGVVHHAHVDINFTKIQESDEVVAILEAMKGS